MKNRVSSSRLWQEVRKHAPAAHREGTTPAEVARLVRAQRRALNVRPTQQYAVLLRIERELLALAGHR